LGASHGGGGRDATRVTCFCSFCEHKARERGINPERALAGHQALANFVHDGRAQKHPVDSYYVTPRRAASRRGLDTLLRQ
jgi:hypothetical protein